MTLSKPMQTLLIGANIWTFGEGMLGPLLAVFAERLGGNIMTITGGWAAFLVVTGALQIHLGKHLAGKNVAKIMVAGYSLNALLTFGYIFVETPLQLCMLQAGIGIAAAFAGPTWYVLYAKHSNPEIASMEWGLAGGQSQIATACAILIGGAVVQYFSFTTLFFFMGVVQSIAAIYQSQILSPTFSLALPRSLPVSLSSLEAQTRLSGAAKTLS